MDLLYLSDHQTRLRPQTGTPCELSWEQFAGWLAEPVWGSDKTEAGGYSPAKYKDDTRHLNKLVHIGALVFDIDVGGEVDRVAKAMEDYSCVVHETFSSTEAYRRCRLLVEIEQPIDGFIYTAVHKKFRQTLVSRHVHADEHATDASRLSYFPVRRKDSGYQFAVTKGKQLDARTMGREVAYVVGKHVDITNAGTTRPHATATKQYIESAIASARFNIEQANEGSRHATLLKESLSLSRPELGLSLEQVEDALFDTALLRMGTHRTHEIRAAIQSGFAKMRQRS